MAINKKQSSLWVKIVLIFVVVAFIASLLPAFFMGNTGGTQDASGASETAAALERIANDHLPAVNSYTAVLSSEPTSYTALVGLGNTYFDWGSQIQQTVGASTGNDLPMWLSAATLYSQALTVQPGDPSVATDFAIALFYSGQTDRAIEVIEQVQAESPEFGPAYFNAGVFYRFAGDTGKAIANLERYLELEPEGGSAPAATNILAELRAAAPSGEATTTP